MPARPYSMQCLMGHDVGAQVVQEAVPGWVTTLAPTATRPESVQINRSMPDKEVCFIVELK